MVTGGIQKQSVGRLLLYHSFCSVIFFEAVCSQETADQETSNDAKISINGHPPGRGGAGEYCLF